MKKILLLVTISFLIGLGVRAAQSEVVINEIAWMGTEKSHYDEWIELYNPGSTIDLEGWILKAEDGSPEIHLKGEIKEQAFFILERTDDDTLPDIEKNQIYTGGLHDQGENLKLIDDQGRVVDQVESELGWKAGNKAEHKTMERDSQGWHTSREQEGTPNRPNSEPIPQSEQMPAKPLTSSLNQGISKTWFTLMVALTMSLFSGAVIYFLKRELKRKDN